STRMASALHARNTLNKTESSRTVSPRRAYLPQPLQFVCADFSSSGRRGQLACRRELWAEKHKAPAGLRLSGLAFVWDLACFLDYDATFSIQHKLLALIESFFDLLLLRFDPFLQQLLPSVFMQSLAQTLQVGSHEILLRPHLYRCTIPVSGSR